MGHSLSAKAVVLGSLIYAIASRSYHRHYDDAESWLFVDENELNALQNYWDENLLWDKSDIITIDNGYTHLKYQIKCIHNENENLCACQRDNYAAIHKCQEYSYHQQKKGFAAAAINSDMYYRGNDDSYSYVIGNELNDFDGYWLYDDIWDTSDIINIDNGYKTIDYEMKCINDVNQYLCACRSFHNGPIYECEPISVDPYKRDKNGHSNHFRAKQEISNLLLTDNENHSYLNFNELNDFDVYWYDNEIWDTSEMITIDNGYKTTKYEIKCVKHGESNLCACQSNHYGPIYECHNPYETEKSDASTMDSNLIALHAADFKHPYQRVTVIPDEFGEAVREKNKGKKNQKDKKDEKEYLHAVGNILVRVKNVKEEMYGQPCSGVFIKTMGDEITSLMLTAAHCLIDGYQYIIDKDGQPAWNPTYNQQHAVSDVFVSFYKPPQEFNEKMKKTASSGNKNDKNDGKEDEKDENEKVDPIRKRVFEMQTHERVYYEVAKIELDPDYQPGKEIKTRYDVALITLGDVWRHDPKDSKDKNKKKKNKKKKQANPEDARILDKLRELSWKFESWEQMNSRNQEMPELYYAGYSGSSTLQVVKYPYLKTGQSMLKHPLLVESYEKNFKGIAMGTQSALKPGHSGGPIFYLDPDPTVVAVFYGTSDQPYRPNGGAHIYPTYIENGAVKLHATTIGGNLFKYNTKSDESPSARKKRRIGDNQV